MAESRCPTCKQVFSDGGFCPHDGTRLDAEASYDHLIGQTLGGRYRVERKIGEGGMGVVFAARHTVIERPLAIKVLKKEIANDPATIQRFVREAKAASKIGHPNIVDVIDFGTTPDGMTYSVMELVDGQTLSAVLKSGGPMPFERALSIGSQIARALVAAHAKGIIHRDLKSENVFLVPRPDGSDFVKIVDFGIAKITSTENAVEPKLTRAGAVFGTAEYMAPEQAAGKGDTDQRVDVYALGTILYETLVGRVPHRGENTLRTIAMQMLDPIVPPSAARPDLHIPRDLEVVVMHALAKDRDQRCSTMSALLAELEQVRPSQLLPAAVPGLVTLPPGASPSQMRPPVLQPAPSAPTLPDGSPPRQEGKGRSHRPSSDSFSEHTEVDLPVHRRARWPAVLALLAAAGFAIAAVVYAVRARSASPTDVAAAASASDAAAAMPEPTIDGGVVVAEVPMDATMPVDGRVRPADRVPRPAPPDASMVGLTPRGTIALTIVTKPERGTVYRGHSYRGPSGVTVEEPFGARETYRCTLPGHDDGQVEIRFDSESADSVVLCVMKRAKRCVDNIKNPFDDCPD